MSQVASMCYNFCMYNFILRLLASVIRLYLNERWYVLFHIACAMSIFMFSHKALSFLSFRM